MTRRRRGAAVTSQGLDGCHDMAGDVVETARELVDASDMILGCHEENNLKVEIAIKDNGSGRRLRPATGT